jgi:hypothetical protein
MRRGPIALLLCLLAGAAAVQTRTRCMGNGAFRFELGAATFTTAPRLSVSSAPPSMVASWQKDPKTGNYFKELTVAELQSCEGCERSTDRDLAGRDALSIVAEVGGLPNMRCSIAVVSDVSGVHVAMFWCSTRYSEVKIMTANVDGNVDVRTMSGSGRLYTTPGNGRVRIAETHYDDALVVQDWSISPNADGESVRLFDQTSKFAVSFAACASGTLPSLPAAKKDDPDAEKQQIRAFNVRRERTSGQGLRAARGNYEARTNGDGLRMEWWYLLIMIGGVAAVAVVILLVVWMTVQKSEKP